jgi:SAM-dependent methyltransferase
MGVTMAVARRVDYAFPTRIRPIRDGDRRRRAIVSEQAAPISTLTQRGRAGLELLGTIQKMASGPVRAAAAQRFAEHPDGHALGQDWRRRMAQGTPDAVAGGIDAALAIARQDPLFRLERFCQRHVALGIYELGIPAIEERRAALTAQPRTSPVAASGSLELDPTIEFPDYYTAAEWHLRPGGWEGYDLYGPLGRQVIPLIFRHGGVAAVPVGGKTASHRADVLRQLPKPAYRHIYEPGCGPIPTLRVAHQLFPEARLTGSDLSPILLREGHAAAAALGLTVDLKQCDAARDTREPDASVDAVVTFALHHELPLAANRALFREMFRILAPGGDIVLADPPPFREITPFHAALMDWETKHRAEPFFSAACAADWGAELRDAGFTDVSAYPIGPDAYPWVTRATKPV